MKKKLLFLTLFLSFGMGWLSFSYSSQPKYGDTPPQESFLSDSSGFYSINGLVSERNTGSEIPAFKVDWTQDGKINSNWSSESVRYIRISKSDYWTGGSDPRFDVRILFLQFFYTW